MTDNSKSLNSSSNTKPRTLPELLFHLKSILSFAADKSHKNLHHAFDYITNESEILRRECYYIYYEVSPTSG